MAMRAPPIALLVMLVSLNASAQGFRSGQIPRSVHVSIERIVDFKAPLGIEGGILRDWLTTASTNDDTGTLTAAIVAVSQAVEIYEQARAQRRSVIPAVSNEAIRTMLVGQLVAVVHFDRLKRESSSEYPHLPDAILALVSETTDLFKQRGRTWNRRAVPELVAVFRLLADLKNVRTDNLPQAFARAFKPRMEKINATLAEKDKYRTMDDYWRAIQRACEVQRD